MNSSRPPGAGSFAGRQVARAYSGSCHLRKRGLPNLMVELSRIIADSGRRSLMATRPRFSVTSAFGGKADIREYGGDVG